MGDAFADLLAFVHLSNLIFEKFVTSLADIDYFYTFFTPSYKQLVSKPDFRGAELKRTRDSCQNLLGDLRRGFVFGERVWVRERIVCTPLVHVKLIFHSFELRTDWCFFSHC